MIDTVIFDLDGLLIDSERSFYEMDRKFLARFGKSFSLDEYIKYHCGKTVIDNMTSFIAKYDLPISIDEAIKSINTAIQAETEKGIPLKDGARELLAYLKDHHYKIVLATSSVEDRAMTLLIKNGIAAYFGAQVFGPNVKRGKPYPDIFLKAAEKVGSEPKNALVLEDSEAGIRAAHDAGMKVICIPDLKVPDIAHQRLTTDVLNSLRDVIDYLEDKKRRLSVD